MLRGSKNTAITIAEKVHNLLASNWQGSLNTVVAEAKGCVAGKGGIHTSKVKYFVKKGKPYIWVPESDLHNVNTVIDERGSFAVTRQLPGSLGKLLASINKLPSRIALVGEVVKLEDGKSRLAKENLRQTILSEAKATKEFNYSVSGVLSSANLSSTSRAENLQELLDDSKQYTIYKFNASSLTYIDANGGSNEVDLEDLKHSKADPLSLYSTSLIDGINHSEVRRRALMLFCAMFLHTNVKDALVLSIDRNGFDVLGKMGGPTPSDGPCEQHWEELRFTFEEEARDVEKFCKQLVQMEEEALEVVSGLTGI